MKKIFIVFFVLPLIINALPTELSAAYQVPFDVDANAVYFVNLDTDTVVYEKNAGEKIYPASVTKIMTAVLALENIKNIKTEIITVEPYMLEEFLNIDYSYSNGGLRNFEEFTAEDLLYGILLQSASDAADVIAARVGGNSIPNFIDMMNKKAKELGMNGTHFVNPHGLHDPDHYTTARDLYLLAKYAMNVPGFMEIAQTTVHGFKTNKRPNGEFFIGTNYLQDQNNHPDLYYKPLRGIKTGTTEEAGSCLVSSASLNGYNYLLVLMGEPLRPSAAAPAQEGEEQEEITDYNPKKCFTETPKFYNWAFENFTIKELVPKNNLAGEVRLNLCAETDHLPLCTYESFTQLIPGNYEASSIRLVNHVPEYVNAPVKKGDLIGTADIVLSGEVIGSLNLYAAESYERSGLYYVRDILLRAVESKFFKYGLICLALVFLFSIMSSLRAGRTKKKRQTKANKNRVR
ncbi:MAG: D-alanyl-D-alanine carboxypeptidase [Oscillospiraceae bacterium]|jgi:D-alanyl-D-alanine carboxypeptidase (penicillin-binding protein 5/6)|nr:D-alanyl-D-alanine carboxypeptidase [Oscillospiraceae bacterium]